MLQLTSSRVAKPRTRSPEVVRRQFGNFYFVPEFLHHMPNGLPRQSLLLGKPEVVARDRAMVARSDDADVPDELGELNRENDSCKILAGL